jgi:Domain of unknown function (DUF6438)
MISLLKKKYSLLALLILITAISCKKKKETVAPVAEVKVETPVVAKKTFDDVNLKQLGEPLMVYEKTLCFGKCPVFTFTIYNNGFATYEGKQNVEKIGFYGTELARINIDELKKSLVESKYFDMEEIYNTPKVTDVPSVFTTVTIESKRKKIMAKMGAPEELKNIHRLIDRFIKYTELIEMPNPKEEKK